MRGRRTGALSAARCSGFTTGAVAASGALAEGSDSPVETTMAAAPVAVDPVLVAGAFTTGATTAVVRCAAPIFVEAGSLRAPVCGRNISSPASATAAAPAVAYSIVRLLRTGSGELAS